jgi:hypothetical protein
MGVAIGCFAFAFMAGDKPDALLARWGFVACALGMLSKGLIGIALPGLVILVWLVWTRQLKKIRHLPWFSGLALWALIALPWFVLAQQKYPGFFNYMFIDQQLRRYTTATYNNPQPAWFYLLSLVVLLFPWAFFALNLVRLTVRRALGAPPDAVPLMAKEWLSLCWIWVVTITVFFSIPQSKLIGYILPVIPALALLSALGWERAMAHRAHAGKLFAGLCLLNIGLVLGVSTQVGTYTRTSRAQDVAWVLACAVRPSDTVYVSGAFPYDLPFYAQTRKPLVVLDHWPSLRQHAGDGWQRELFEGADFDAQAGQVLQLPEALAQAGQAPGNWYVATKADEMTRDLTGWTLFYEGAGWVLYQSGRALTAKSPEPAEPKGLPGCQHQRDP